MGMERRLRAAHGDDIDDEKPVEPVGKKERAKAAAKTAGQGSAWGDDLLPGVVN